MQLGARMVAQGLGLHREVGLFGIALELTDTYSPTAIDSAPATNAAMPAISTSLRPVRAAATPTTTAAVERMPSFAPSTAARSQGARWLR